MNEFQIGMCDMSWRVIKTFTFHNIKTPTLKEHAAAEPL